MDENFWIAVGAVAALASAVGAGISLVVGTWLRQRSRPEADWAFTVYANLIGEDPYSGENELMGHIRIHGSLANAGDAPAFNLKLAKPSSAYLSTQIKAVTARAQVHEWMAVMMPGDKVDFTATIAPAAWDTSVLEIDWVTSPTRLKKHLQWTLNLAESVADPRSIPQPDPSV